MRKMISFKIENLPDKQRKIVDDWANGQANIQQSMANIIMHIVEFTGNEDVMDFNIQRRLHNIFSTSGIENVVQNKEGHLNTTMTMQPPVKKSEQEEDYPNSSILFED